MMKAKGETIDKVNNTKTQDATMNAFQRFLWEKEIERQRFLSTRPTAFNPRCGQPSLLPNGLYAYTERQEERCI